MNAVWQVQEAKNRFSEVIDRALHEGPQTVTRHGRPVVRVVRVVAVTDERERKAPHAGDGFVEFLLSAPKIEGGLELPERSSIKPLEPLGE